MADLATHAAVAWASGRRWDARIRSIFLIGTILPDVLYKTGLYLFHGSTWFCEPTHAPLPMLLVAYAGALMFGPNLRRRAFVVLSLGIGLHLLIDAGKDYMGQGVILWAYPFSINRVELGLYQTNETLYLLLPSLLGVLFLEWMLSRRKRVSPTPAER